MNRRLGTRFGRGRIPADGAAVAAFDPSTLALSLWVRGSYTGSPWAGESSAGASGSRSQTQPTAALVPGVGTAVNGYTPADFDGSNDCIGSDNNLDEIFDVATGAIAVLFKADTAASTAANAYDEPCLAADGGSGVFELSFTSSGIRGQLNASGEKQTAYVACATGSWHWAFMYYTGGTLSVQLDGGTPATVALGTVLQLSSFVIGRNYDSTKYFDGKILEVIARDVAAWSASDITNIISYGNSRYGLSLT